MNISGNVTQKFKVSGDISAKQEISGSIGKPHMVYKDDYEQLKNKPKINDIELIGNKTSEEIGIKAMTNLEIEALLNNFA